MCAMASAGEQSRATVLSACFSLLLCNFGSWQGEIVPAGVCAPRKDRRLRRLTMRNHLCKPEVSPGGCNGERRQAAALSACKKLRCGKCAGLAAGTCKITTAGGHARGKATHGTAGRCRSHFESLI